MHEYAIWAGIPASIDGFMFRESGRAPFSDAQSAVVFLSEIHELAQGDDTPKWVTNTLDAHDVTAHFGKNGEVNFRGKAAVTLANAVCKDLEKKYNRAIARGKKILAERQRDPEAVQRMLVALGLTPEAAEDAIATARAKKGAREEASRAYRAAARGKHAAHELSGPTRDRSVEAYQRDRRDRLIDNALRGRAPASHKPPQRTPAQRLEHAVQQALLLGNVPKQAKTVLAWKFRMDGEGPWTLRDIVKDNDLDPDVLAGWLCEVVEGCPHVGDTCVTGGGAAATTTWERV